MSTETYTAELCSRTYNGTANRYPNSSGTESPAATHGFYESNGNWVGMVRLPVSLKGRAIVGIKLKLTANTAGNTSEKSVYIYSSNYQTKDAAGTGSIYPNQLLGSIHGVFRNQTTEVALSDSLLTDAIEYFASGNQMLILYDPTSSEANYCRFTEIVIEVTFGFTIMYRYKGTWIKCNVYIRYNGQFVHCCPLYRKAEKWVECSSG